MRALNVNTVDEVPDSSWFTNRIGRRDMTVADVAKGPDRVERVSLDGWVVSGGKSSGVQPGFRMTDPAGQLYQIEVDPPSNPELASGAEIIGTAFYHAIGYNTVDVYLAEIDRAALVISERATIRDPLNGKRRRLKKSDLDEVFERAARRAGRPLPRARQPLCARQAARQLPLLRHAARTTRTTSFAHEHRRELRGARVFGAWLNHDDSRGINSLDMLETDRRARVGQALHVRLRLDPRQRHGLRPASSARQRIHLRAAARMADAGDARRIRPAVDAHRLSRRSAVGRPVRGEVVRPDEVEARVSQRRPSTTCGPDDAFWAARIVARFTDEMIGAVVQKAQYSDPRATRVHDAGADRASRQGGGGVAQPGLPGRGPGARRRRRASRSRTRRSPRGPPIRPRAISFSGFASTTPPPRARRLASRETVAAPAGRAPAGLLDSGEYVGVEVTALTRSARDGRGRRRSSSAAAPRAGRWWASSAGDMQVRQS